MSWVIKDNQTGNYYSLKMAANHANPHGGLTPDVDKALQFARADDAESYINRLLPFLLAYCQIVSV